MHRNNRSRAIKPLGFSLAMLILGGCGANPVAQRQQAQRLAQQEAEIAAEMHRQKQLEQLGAKLEQQSQDANAKWEADLAGRSVALGETLTVEGLEITPVRAEMRKVQWRELNTPDQELRQGGPYLVLTIRVKNISEDQTFKPASQAKVIDNLGKKLKSPFPELSRAVIDGSCTDTPLTPGEEGEVILCVRPENAKARSYEWEINTAVNNKPSFAEASGRWRVKFQADKVASTGS